MDDDESCNLMDTIGGIGVELDNLRRRMQTENQLSGLLEQRVAAENARADATRLQAETLEAAVASADVQLVRQERAADLARRAAEVAEQHAGQLADRLKRERAASEAEHRRLGERVARLEATAEKLLAQQQQQHQQPQQQQHQQPQQQQHQQPQQQQQHQQPQQQHQTASGDIWGEQRLGMDLEIFEARISRRL